MKIKVKDYVFPEGNGEELSNKIGYVEGTWSDVTGQDLSKEFLKIILSDDETIHPAIFFFTKRTTKQYTDNLPYLFQALEDKTQSLYVKIDGFGHILLRDEIEVIEE